MAKKFTGLSKTLQRQFRDLVKKLPVDYSYKAANFFKENFNRQGFLDKSLKKWQPRKAERGSKRKSGRGILIDSGTLKRSITPAPQNGQAGVDSDTPYSARHNEGLHGMPQRQFMGESEVLMDELEKDLFDKLDDIWEKA